ncbi:hypothetical protein SUGI_1010420 [Cryptomeria japonica]|uniref:uncharacterized protein LOC131079202 n=1 Tax=Cryptomeria japonica TaxID=3369 RepID=UPI002414982A|nr:uncharacterized protein LOC131079202 [Cryptomeria japonica]GLJ47847.1 hypothetical protein SUGI_1010420 [Cryptomeria japonica]
MEKGLSKEHDEEGYDNVLAISEEVIEKESISSHSALDNDKEVEVADGDEDISNVENRGHLFEKKMTASDVCNKLHRLVIPKHHVERHFPKDKLEDCLTFVDTSDSREWKFRFVFWKSSKSYALTTKWIDFVKYKDLKRGDTVYFSKDSKMPSDKFYITVHVSQDLMSNDCVQEQSGSDKLLKERLHTPSSSLRSLAVTTVSICEPKELMKSDEKGRVDQNTDHIFYPCHQKTSNCFHGSQQLEKRKAMEDESEKKSDDVDLKLFGFEISASPKAQRLMGDPKEKKQKDGEVGIESKEKEVSGIEIVPEVNGQNDEEDLDLTLRL